MTRLYLVRHGRATAGWGTDADPGLDEIGRVQAEHVAERLRPLGLTEVLTSPMLRCRQTSSPLCTASALLACQRDTVVFSHFVAINAAIGVATGDDRVVIRGLDNCSVTVVDTDDGALDLIEGGHEADTLIR